MLRFNLPSGRTFLTVVIAIGVVCQIGCNTVKRRMIIRSHPEGAFVTIDRQPVGYAPVSVPFTYYGVREIQLEKDGYQPIKVAERIAPPFYDSFPVSFFTENFALRERRDERVMDFELVPKTQVNESQLLDRANNTRSNIQRGTVVAPLN